MELFTVRQVAETITALGVAAATVYSFLRWVLPILRRWGVRWRLFWSGFDTVPLIHDNLAALGQGIERLEAFGKAEAEQGALRGQQIEQHGVQLTSMAKNLALTNMTMRATLATDPRMATFEADEQGRLIDASKTYLRWTGRQFSEVAGWGWITTVHPDDRPRVRAEWESAVRDCRQSVMRYRMIGVEGVPFEVEATATPIPELTIPCEKFVGVIHRLSDE